ncbi:MAG TPA: FtsX-like permease family protein, partial [Candidatus Acidoferrum sp.]|nr:FtsX-like permease family protein [Candidatus Acidoferrum sp.]
IADGGKSGELYEVARVLRESTGLGIQAVVVGSRVEGGVDPGLPRFDEFAGDLARTESWCIVGSKVATALSAHVRDRILFRKDSREESCRIFMIWSTGDERDYQVSTNLALVQRLAARPGQLSVIRIRVPGPTEAIESYAKRLQQRISDAEVRPLRQFSEAQAKIYSRISGLLTAATALILTLTIFCVMAAMTNIAAERRNDVGMMKAIGGSARSVLNLFLTEAVVLGFAGGLIGAAFGIVLSIVLGKAVFGVAAAPRLIVYPISVALTVIVAILGAYPLRRLVNIRPATVFRGEA